MQNIIYALQDPRTYEIRYIGKSTKGLERPNCHLLPCYYNAPKFEHYPIYRWIRKLIRQGYEPIIILIQSFETSDYLNQAEIYWIKYFSEQKRLLNATIGGDGSVGYKWTEEQKRNYSKIHKGRKKPESYKKYMSDHWNEFHTIDDKFKEAVSNGVKNWWKTLDPEKRKNCSSNILNLAGKNKKAIIDDLGNKFISLTEAAEKNSCSIGAISLSIKENRSLRSGRSFQYV